MNEREIQSFNIVYEFYKKWRETVIETDAQWREFAQDVGKMGIELDIDHNPLGWHLMSAVLDTFNDLYKGGMKPLPATHGNYFGRDDI